MSDYCRQNLTPSSFKGDNSWVVLSPIEKQIKDKIEKVGKPLKDWDINIYRGILTGYNEAFIIDGATKDALIAKSAKNAEIIRPILRGRDIKRYRADFANLYIIATFPSMNYDIEDYPAIKEHLLAFGYDRLKQTGEPGARKKTNNQWFETQDSISYWDDFSKQKIVWIELTDHPNFMLDTDGYYINNTIFFMTGKQLKYITAFLNSRICEWYFDKICATSGVGTRRWIKMYIDLIRVPYINESETSYIDDIVDKIHNDKKLGVETASYEELIDRSFYDAFCLSEEEISFIEQVL